MEKNISVLTLVILVISVLLGYQLVYAPKMSTLRALEELQQTERKKQLLYDELTVYEKKVASYEKRWFPRGKEEITLLNRVREMAGEAPVHITAMVPQKKEDFPSKGYRKFPIAVAFSSTYHQLGAFMAEVENTETLMKIDRLFFTTYRKEEEGPPLRCDVVLSVFSVP